MPKLLCGQGEPLKFPCQTETPRVLGISRWYTGHRLMQRQGAGKGALGADLAKDGKVFFCSAKYIREPWSGGDTCFRSTQEERVKERRTQAVGVTEGDD
ncbi:hypothetical protein NDU88_004659 [Pleurodeles waltl]|uniref:Uncharacterized protein n=1 Tax=Pleurodeles waltl TaxID=8319 RepID=A0AAV7TRW7_PLEWA|nr:hypothetical protein NDU88_004659 [Pleurodeles waltl]